MGWQPMPRDPKITVVLALLWIGLLIYAIAQGDPLGYVAVAVVGIFIALPLLLAWLLNRHERRR